MAGFCVEGNEPFCSIKGEDLLHNFQEDLARYLDVRYSSSIFYDELYF
jgi:hypothetical protein